MLEKPLFLVLILCFANFCLSHEKTRERDRGEENNTKQLKWKHPVELIQLRFSVMTATASFFAQNYFSSLEP
jgi:hypothetical protein